MTHLIDNYEKVFCNEKAVQKMCKSSKSRYQQSMMDKLENLEKENPQAYWKLLNSLRKGEEHDCSTITNDEWVTHYQNLFSINNNKYVDISDEMNTLFSEPYFNSLDYKITQKEILEAAKLLKDNKACGIDNIPAEVIKCSMKYCIGWYENVFNFMYNNAVYPNLWRVGIVSNLFKKGDRYDPNNYRGLTITSCMSKLFSIVLNRRLENYLKINGIIKPHQIGFKKGARTTDHIFVIKTLMDKFRNKRVKKSLYMCFVDFEKAYDSVWHKGLILKLLKNGIRGRFARLIQCIYQVNRMCVKTNGILSGYFNGYKGVRQGDVMSPNLFNIFVNDIPDCILNDHDTPDLHNQPVGCLMYADDLVILSHTAPGLQKRLSELENYCTKWHLKVNVKKTKIMVVNSSNSINNECFKIYDNLLEIVDKYSYLGVMLSSDGKMLNAQLDMRHRALKAIFKTQSILAGYSVRPRLSMAIFDKLIKPVCMYGCEAWIESALNIRNRECDLGSLFMQFKKAPIEKVHVKYCKIALGVNNKSSNVAVSGELGRFPIMIDIMLHSLKFYIHVKENKSNNPLLQCAMVETESRQCKWLKLMQCALKASPGLQLHNLQVKDIPVVAKSLKYLYVNMWKKEVHGNNINPLHGKLCTYRKIKQNFCYENYLDDVRNRDDRSAVTKLRISAHKLFIERGRYIRPPLDRNERICSHCLINKKAHIEDEFHALIVCPKYCEKRKVIFNSVECICPNFKDLDDYEKFIFIMSAEGQISKLVSQLCKHVILYDKEN